MSSTETVVKSAERKTLRNPPNEPHILPLTILRIFLLCTIYFAYLKADVIQGYIDVLWAWLRHQWWYETVYFETFLVPCYAVPALFPYRLIHRTGIGEQYRIEKIGGQYGVVPTHKNIVRETLEYSWPFFILDTFHVKHYHDVSDDVISEKRKDWIQKTRALPLAAPQLEVMVRHLLVALVLYDLCFFLSHYTFHRHATLYKLFHSVHHDHDSVNAKVANQLHVVERIILVLSANFGLKVQGAHPLTRSFFVFLFLSALIDNHSGYDFPYTYDKILPRGLIAGARRHYEHHQHGTRNYQPFFTYIDATLEWLRKRRKSA